jgi:hypothetical protein
MGNQASAPEPGTKFQVIGAGLPRTGTASFSEALRILLQGPVYHGGTQVTRGPEVDIRSWITLFSHFPPETEHSRKITNEIIKSRLEGYAAATDLPFSGMVDQMLELYPDAKVICTVRDPEAWAKSMGALKSTVMMSFLRFILFPVQGMRHFPDFIDGVVHQWEAIFGKEEDITKCYYAHIENIKRIVPRDRLLFFDVKEGWEPLCKALGKDVPEGIPFPRINDSDAIARRGKEVIIKGLVRWLIVFCTLALASIAFVILKQ